MASSDIQSVTQAMILEVVTDVTLSFLPFLIHHYVSPIYLILFQNCPLTFISKDTTLVLATIISHLQYNGLKMSHFTHFGTPAIFTSTATMTPWKHKSDVTRLA